MIPFRHPLGFDAIARGFPHWKVPEESTLRHWDDQMADIDPEFARQGALRMSQAQEWPSLAGWRKHSLDARADAQHRASLARRDLERAVSAAWHERHRVTCEFVALGQVRRAPGIAAPYPGFEAAHRELVQAGYQFRTPRELTRAAPTPRPASALQPGGASVEQLVRQVSAGVVVRQHRRHTSDRRASPEQGR